MLKRNLAANFIGQGWTAFVGLIFVPVYIRYLGIESYGLIGMFAVMQAWLGMLDMGMTPALSREMARYTAGTSEPKPLHDLLRSVEYIAVGLFLIVGLGIWSMSSWLAENWLTTEQISQAEVARALSLMGAVAGLRFVEGIYRSSILGLQRQVLYNIINSTLATLRGIGAIAVLAWWSPTVEAFFLWQGAASIFSLLVLAHTTYTILPKQSQRGEFSLQSLRRIGRFASGLTALSVLAAILTQVDKVILSKLLTLSDYGYYTVTTVIAGTVSSLMAPIPQTWTPRLSQLQAEKNDSELAASYHLGAQLVTVFVGSAASIMAFFAADILNIWTHDTNIAENSAKLLAVLALSNCLSAMFWIPYAAQFAYGWTGLALKTYLVAVVVTIPATIWVTPRYGAEGAAWIAVSYNAANLLIGTPLMFRKILTREKWRWYSYDLAFPLLAAASVAGAAKYTMPSTLTVSTTIAWIAIFGLTTTAAAAIAAPNVRNAIKEQANRGNRKKL